MSTRTISIREEVYVRLDARKRDDESIAETIERLLEEADPDWRDGFGSLSDVKAEELERIADQSR